MDRCKEHTWSKDYSHRYTGGEGTRTLYGCRACLALKVVFRDFEGGEEVSIAEPRGKEGE